EPASSRVVQEPAVALDQCRVRLVRARADDDRVEPTEVPASERLVVEQGDGNTHAAQSLGHLVRRAPYISDVLHGGKKGGGGRDQSPGGLYIGGGMDMRVVAGEDTRIVSLTVGVGARRKCDWAGLKRCGCPDPEGKSLPLVFLRQPELLRRNGRPP